MKRGIFLILFLLLLTGLAAGQVRADAPYIPSVQSAALWFNEAETVYLTNDARKDAGLPPLRWNLQLTEAARWFSWDSIANRPEGFCNHQDTNGNWPGTRALAFGYLGGAGAENAFCGYLSPANAVAGWLASDGHRDNLLSPGHREVGLGYYLSGSEGYITQDFGADPVYAPVIINLEDLETPSTSVNLYIYDRQTGGGWQGMDAATEMQVSNDACFRGASWEPYRADKAWQITGGASGWRTVYVRTRDNMNRTLSASDSIYLGAAVPTGEITNDQLSSTSLTVPLTGLNSGGRPYMQFSANWVADDTFETFGLNWGVGERVNDPAALGGTAFALGDLENDAESHAWVWTTEFFRSVPMIAYARLKVTNNTSTDPIISLRVTGGQERQLRGTDFRAANQYQEFALPFTFPAGEDFQIIEFNVFGNTNTQVYVDAVTFFTTPIPFSSEYEWHIPGSNYRGQGVWVRYSDGSNNFSEFSEANSLSPGLSVDPLELRIPAARDWNTITRRISVQATCLASGWTVTDNASWLETAVETGAARLSFNPATLRTGVYNATVTISAAGEDIVRQIPITVEIYEHLHDRFFPIVN